MNLQGSITELQDLLARLYIELQQRFKENQMIRDLWSAMAHDVTEQKHGIGAIPHSFWAQLKDEQGLFSAAISDIRHQPIEKKEDFSLTGCFERALLYEEPTILNVYVPIIRKLRGNWTDQSLDFYIMVKAHLARVTRVTQSFAGNPVITQRSNLLLQRFEKEVQEPHVEPVPVPRQANAAQPHSKEKQPAKLQNKAASKPAAAITKHAATHHGRSKPPVEKMRIQSRRARR